jgi:hypothetical protein
MSVSVHSTISVVPISPIHTSFSPYVRTPVIVTPPPYSSERTTTSTNLSTHEKSRAQFTRLLAGTPVLITLCPSSLSVTERTWFIGTTLDAGVLPDSNQTPPTRPAPEYYEFYSYRVQWMGRLGRRVGSGFSFEAGNMMRGDEDVVAWLRARGCEVK